MARVHVLVHQDDAQPGAVRHHQGGVPERPVSDLEARGSDPLRSYAARQAQSHQIRQEERDLLDHGVRENCQPLLHQVPLDRDLQRAPEAQHGADRALQAVLAVVRVQVHPDPGGGEVRAAQAHLERAGADQGLGRRPDHEGEHFAAELHQQVEAERVRAQFGHGLHHAERGEDYARHSGDRAEARLGANCAARAELVEDDREADVELYDAVEAVPEHPGGDFQEDREEGAVHMGPLLQHERAADRGPDSVPENREDAA